MKDNSLRMIVNTTPNYKHTHTQTHINPLVEYTVYFVGTVKSKGFLKSVDQVEVV